MEGVRRGRALRANENEEQEQRTYFKNLLLIGKIVGFVSSTDTPRYFCGVTNCSRFAEFICRLKSNDRKRYFCGVCVEKFKDDKVFCMADSTVNNIVE